MHKGESTPCFHNKSSEDRLLPRSIGLLGVSCYSFHTFPSAWHHIFLFDEFTQINVRNLITVIYFTPWTPTLFLTLISVTMGHHFSLNTPQWPGIIMHAFTLHFTFCHATALLLCHINFLCPCVTLSWEQCLSHCDYAAIDLSLYMSIIGALLTSHKGNE